MSALESFWNLYCYLLYKFYYYDEYVRKSAWYDRITSIIVAVTTSTSVASWIIWDNFNWLWAIFVGAAQLVSLVKPYFHFTEHVCLVNILSPKAKRIIIDMEMQGNTFTESTPQEVILEAMETAAKKFDELEATYISPGVFLTREKCQKTAELYRDCYLKARYKDNVSKKEESLV